MIVHEAVNAVEVAKLTIAFGGFRAVDNISFAVKKGEIFGFLGANGAGKTTAIRAICGLLTPTAGTIRVAGILSGPDTISEIKAKTGYMSQKFTLYGDMTVMENLEFTAALRKISPKEFLRRTGELLEFIKFGANKNSLVKSLPGGVKQEIALCSALLGEPEIIFLDEPTAGVSPSSRARFWELIGRLAKQGKTVFVTTHYMDEAEQCGRIALMQSGKIIALGSLDELAARHFPEPLYEIESAGGADFIKRAQDGGAADISPYGLRYHAAVKNEQKWNVLTAEAGPGIAIRRIAPRLEDIFIKLAGGA